MKREASSGASPVPLTPWPPLIPASRAPWTLRVRDTVLTLAAWLLYAWLMRNALLVILAGIDPEFASDRLIWLNQHVGPWIGRQQMPTPLSFWADFRGYVVIIVLLVCWMCGWAMWNRKRLARRAPEAGTPVRPEWGQQYVPPPPLQPHTRAGEIGMNGAWLPLLEGQRRVRVEFNDDGSVKGITPASPEASP